MAQRKVWTYFYESFINLDVLARNGVTPGEVEVATLHGFDIRIQPLANLVRSAQDCVYGIVVRVTHADPKRRRCRRSPNREAPSRIGVISHVS